MSSDPSNWLGAVVPLAIVGLVLFIRWRRLGRHTPLRLNRPWIVPALLIALTVALVLHQPPTPTVWLVSAAALAVGLAVGWQRGRTTRIAVDPDTGALTQATSAAALFLLLGLVVVKTVGRELLESGALGAVDPALVTDPLIGFALGVVLAQRVEMWLRARRLLAERGVRTA